MARVSVCCSVLNQSEWFEDMLASVFAQSFTDWEFIVVDDGSTEDIAAVIEKFNDPGGRVKLHRWDENKGIPHGINFAFRQATGEYVQPLAADEVLSPDKLEKQVAYLDAHKEISAVFGMPRTGDLGERPEWEQNVNKAHDRSRLQWLATLINLDDVPLGGCSALWRRGIFEKIGYFDESLVAFSDHEWYCRLVENYDIHMMPYRFAVSRPNPDGVSNGNTSDKVARMTKEIAYVREKHPIVLTDTASKVTVGIPVKDMQFYVGQAMKSVIDQTHTDWELLVVDDGSTDDTAKVVENMIASNPGKSIRLIRHETNLGDRVACKRMVGEATGDFYVSLSADDLIEPTYLERCVKIFQDNAQFEFIASQTDFIAQDGTPHTLPHPFKGIEKASNKTQSDWKARLWYGNVYFGAGMMRTKALRELGSWNPEYGVLADYGMYLALLQRGNIFVIEEDLTHTRIHDKNMSINCDQAMLHATYHKIKSRYYQPRRKLIIATPFYNAQGFSPYISSLVETCKVLTQLGVDFEFWLPTGDAYVQRVKNTIVNQFLERADATELLMVDSDMEWQVQPLLEMLTCQEELIVGSYPQKNSWEKWTSIPKFEKDENDKPYAVERKLPSGSTLIQGKELSGGFVLVKRGILERYQAKYPDLRYVDESADPTCPNRVYTEFFTAGAMQVGDDKKRRFWGEDRSFALRLNEMGERWWIYTGITFRHWGINGWTGNFKTTLDSLKTGEPVLNQLGTAGLSAANQNQLLAHRH